MCNNIFNFLFKIIDFPSIISNFIISKPVEFSTIILFALISLFSLKKYFKKKDGRYFILFISNMLISFFSFIVEYLNIGDGIVWLSIVLAIYMTGNYFNFVKKMDDEYSRLNDDCIKKHYILSKRNLTFLDRFEYYIYVFMRWMSCDLSFASGALSTLFAFYLDASKLEVACINATDAWFYFKFICIVKFIYVLFYFYSNKNRKIEVFVAYLRTK